MTHISAARWTAAPAVETRNNVFAFPGELALAARKMQMCVHSADEHRLNVGRSFLVVQTAAPMKGAAAHTSKRPSPLLFPWRRRRPWKMSSVPLFGRLQRRWNYLNSRGEREAAGALVRDVSCVECAFVTWRELEIIRHDQSTSRRGSLARNRVDT